MSRAVDIVTLGRSTYRHLDGTVMPNGYEELVRATPPLLPERPATAPPQRRPGTTVAVPSASPRPPSGAGADADHIDLVRWRENREYTDFLFGKDFCGKTKVRLLLESPGAMRERRAAQGSPSPKSIRRCASAVIRQRVRGMAAVRQEVQLQRRRARREEDARREQAKNEVELRRLQALAARCWRRGDEAAGAALRYVRREGPLPPEALAVPVLTAAASAAACTAAPAATAGPAEESPEPRPPAPAAPAPSSRAGAAARALARRRRDAQRRLVEGTERARYGDYRFRPVWGQALKVLPEWRPGPAAPVQRPRLPYRRQQGFLCICGPPCLPPDRKHLARQTWYGAACGPQGGGHRGAPSAARHPGTARRPESPQQRAEGSSPQREGCSSPATSADFTLSPESRKGA